MSKIKIFTITCFLSWASPVLAQEGPVYNFNFHNRAAEAAPVTPAIPVTAPLAQKTSQKELAETESRFQKIFQRFGIVSGYLQHITNFEQSEENSNLNYSAISIGVFSKISEGVKVVLSYQHMLADTELKMVNLVDRDQWTYQQRTRGFGTRLALLKSWIWRNKIEINVGPSLFYLKARNTETSNLGVGVENTIVDKAYGIEGTAGLNFISGNLSLGPSMGMGKGQQTSTRDHAHYGQERSRSFNFSSLTYQANLAYNF